MAREYQISVAGITVVNAASTLIYIRPHTTLPTPGIEIRRMWIGQSANATSSQQRVRVERQTGTAPVLVSATPTKIKQTDPASVITGATTGAVGTCGTAATTEAGTKAPIFDDAFNVLNGWLWMPTPSETIIIPAGGDAIGLFFPVAPTTLTNWAFGMTFAELG